MKVVMPAFTSVPTVVPRSVSLKNESSPPPLGADRSFAGTSVAVTRVYPPLLGLPDTRHHVGHRCRRQPTLARSVGGAHFRAQRIGVGRVRCRTRFGPRGPRGSARSN